MYWNVSVSHTYIYTLCLMLMYFGYLTYQKKEYLNLSWNWITQWFLALFCINVWSLAFNLCPDSSSSLKYNKLLSYCQIPSWISCNLEGNGRDASNDDFISSSVEMDVYDTTMENERSLSCNGEACAISSIWLNLDGSFLYLK